jgi:hypothetical protein
VRYAAGLPRCPQPGCGSTDYEEDGVAKITPAGATFEPGREPEDPITYAGTGREVHGPQLDESVLRPAAPGATEHAGYGVEMHGTEVPADGTVASVSNDPSEGGPAGAPVAAAEPPADPPADPAPAPRPAPARRPPKAAKDG